MESIDSKCLSMIDLLLRRRSLVAKNQTEPGPTHDEIELILRCATRVPDHARLTPWRIKVIQGQAQERIGKLWAEVYLRQQPDATAKEIEFEAQRPCRAPLLLFIHTQIESTDRIPRWEQILSGGAVCQNILVAATALGFASQWLSEWPAYDDEVKEAMGVSPTDQVLGFIYIGTAKEIPKERARPELVDVVEFWLD